MGYRSFVLSTFSKGLLVVLFPSLYRAEGELRDNSRFLHIRYA